MTKFVPRLYIDTPLSLEQKLVLNTDRLHYLKNVLRLRSGGQVRLFDGITGEWQATYDFQGKTATLHITQQLKPFQPEPDIWLLFAPFKGKPLEDLASSATELGASLFQPVLTEHAVVPRLNHERFLSHLQSAAAQCERLTIPSLNPLIPLSKLLEQWPVDRLLYVALERSDAQSFSRVLSEYTESNGAILIGPEGGFSEKERKLFASYPFIIPVSLGPRILRCETAAIAALACWQAWQAEKVGNKLTQPPLSHIEELFPPLLF